MQGTLETQVRSLGQEDPLEKEMATHLQHSCLKNPMDRGAWQATVHGVEKNLTRLRDYTYRQAQASFRKTCHQVAPKASCEGA